MRRPLRPTPVLRSRIDAPAWQTMPRARRELRFPACDFRTSTATSLLYSRKRSAAIIPLRQAAPKESDEYFPQSLRSRAQPRLLARDWNRDTGSQVVARWIAFLPQPSAPIRHPSAAQLRTSCDNCDGGHKGPYREELSKSQHSLAAQNERFAGALRRSCAKVH